ncbi:DNA-binding transcriptional activator of the SARP family [Streptosporangium subroseum]|uniref:DNA-binding transcriptional activator of the SARP family n=2 Tax=Streptosporangium subroseum TaxID=106412 RepID=A0A239EE38_9ACTN|nr:DNA-binding transcriptional activator of the SARP family [Streptosporangium subroseum]
MRFRVLGPVEVHADDGRVLSPVRRQERCLLGILLLEAGRVVSAERLCGLLWQDDPPERARQFLRSMASRIRALLAEAGEAEPAVRLVSDGGGYRLVVSPDMVDAHRFRRLLEIAAAATELGERDQVLREALALWAGPALHNAAGEQLRQRICADLDELRLYAVEESVAAGLELGRHHELVPELARLTGEHPLRERLVGGYMLALYRAGRAGDALEVYTRTRDLVSDQLGLDPGPALRELHQAILRDEVELPAPAAAPNPSRLPTPGVPAQLPADVPNFIGRETELAQLSDLLGAEVTSPATAGTLAAGSPAVVISAVSGTAGVGKTALAIRFGHRVRPRFPDGQLYVNLRGYDPDRPMTAGDALTRFLRVLGVPEVEIPLEVDERSTRYRSEIADRRMLILLDNASSVEQVRPLLPGTGTCAVVVTSRDSLAALIATHGARRVELDLLTQDEAVALLRTLIGPRADAEPDAVATLAQQCVRLPLALRVAAELAVSRPLTRLAELVAELADLQWRLDLLDAGGDPRAAVATVFSWSVRHLSAETARVFRLLGLHLGSGFDTYNAAALAGGSLPEARRALDTLARANLVHHAGAGRYGMHDLLRTYAADLSAARDGHEQSGAALERLFDYYLATSAAAMDTLYPAEVHRRPRIPAPATPVPDLADPGAARGWLEAEQPTLIAVAAHTAAHGRPSHTSRLSTTLFRYFEAGHNTDALTIHQHALDATRQAGDKAGQAYALHGLGSTYLKSGHYGQATDHLELALDLFRQVGDHVGEARALNNLSGVEDSRGCYGRATEYGWQALDLYRRIGDRVGESRALVKIGATEMRQGHYGEATHHFEQALLLCRQTGDRLGEADALDMLGSVECRQRAYDRAADRHRQAMNLYQDTGDRTGEGVALANLGIDYLGLGKHEDAAAFLQQAYALFLESGDDDGQGVALNGLGEAAYAAGHHADAVTHHSAALAIADDNGAVDEQARAHAGLGRARQALGDPARARLHYDQALTCYADLGVPDTDDVRGHLAALDE